ncbi:MAG: exodeoxyribonuclease III [Candidatus Helarchaeota archaeon]
MSWNVNGIRAAIKKGFLAWFRKRNPDILCIQETKSSPLNLFFDMPEHDGYWHTAEKKGYSGVATFTKISPMSIKKKFAGNDIDKEGRFLQLEFEKFYLINLYFPNAQRELKRLEYKLHFNNKLLEHIEKLRKKGKGIVICGDFNAAHKEIDLANPKSNQNNAGFSPKEREFITELIKKGYIDTFREFDKNPGKYTWWSYRFNARAKNIGWRIDYFFINEEFRHILKSAFILNDVMGSDHCPIGIILNI